MDKKKHSIWGIIGTILLIIFLGGSIIYKLKPQIALFTAEMALNEYSDDIAKCISETKAKTGDQKVVGIEYECAINVAATFYGTDPEKAINLCMINNPFFDIQPGRKYSSGNIEDMYAKRNETIARSSCISSIERRLEKELVQPES
jgi:hypothetical protein